MITSFKKCSSVFALTLLVSCVSVHAMKDDKGIMVNWFGDNADKARLGLQLIGTGLVGGVAYAAKNSTTLAHMGHMINLGSAEVQTSAAVMGGLTTIALLGNEKAAKAAGSIAWRIPAYTLLIASVYSKSCEKGMSWVPLVGKALSENNKVAKGLLLLGSGILLYNGLNKVGFWAEKKFMKKSN